MWCVCMRSHFTVIQQIRGHKLRVNNYCMKEVYLLSADQLFRKYYPRLCHFAWKLLGNEVQAEDIVQEAFTSFLERRHTIADNDTAIKNYLYTTVRNACINVGRDAKITERYFRLNPLETIVDSPVIDQLIHTEVMHQVYTIITTMPQGCQRIFRLGYLEGWSNAKIAETLQVSINTVKTQKQRGMKLLKGKLSPELLVPLCLATLGIC